jgi:hypothetical protein
MKCGSDRSQKMIVDKPTNFFQPNLSDFNSQTFKVLDPNLPGLSCIGNPFCYVYFKFGFCGHF